MCHLKGADNYPHWSQKGADNYPHWSTNQGNICDLFQQLGMRESTVQYIISCVHYVLYALTERGADSDAGVSVAYLELYAGYILSTPTSQHMYMYMQNE